ncbi:MAG TPA: DUF1707 domain-containing protein [Streptosporangiaceae bacterium]|jgi:hypothetical protein
MNDRIRISDADRERVTGRLRDHFAEGRLTREELEERVTAALNAKTVGDLRRVMADLPEPGLVLPPARPLPWAAMRGPVLIRRGPRLLPLALLLLLTAVLLPGGGWVFLGFLQALLVFWLVMGVATVFAAARFRRRMQHQWQQFQAQNQPWYWPTGHSQH